MSQSTETTRPLSSLRPHPENAAIFGGPDECDQWEAILASVKKHGVLEPLVIRGDGTILSGHLRCAAARAAGLKSVPVRVAPPFATYRDELEFLIRSNTDRRQLTKQEIALAFKRLRETPRAEGGTAGKRGGDHGNQHTGGKRQTAASGASAKSSHAAADEAAHVLGVGRHEARALEKVFTTPGVPEELKRAVNRGDVAPTPAAKAIATEEKRQGGAIKDQRALRAVATPPQKPTLTEKSEHEVRVEREAAQHSADVKRLFSAYQEIDAVMTRRPLKSVLGPTEHHELTDLLRDIAIRAWREIESVQGPTNAGRQMSLVALQGGKS